MSFFVGRRRVRVREGSRTGTSSRGRSGRGQARSHGRPASPRARSSATSGSGRCPCSAPRPWPGSEYDWSAFSMSWNRAESRRRSRCTRRPVTAVVPLVVADHLEHQPPIQRVRHQDVGEVRRVGRRAVGDLGVRIVAAQLALEEVRRHAQQGHVGRVVAPLLPVLVPPFREEVSERQVGQVLGLAVLRPFPERAHRLERTSASRPASGRRVLGARGRGRHLDRAALVPRERRPTRRSAASRMRTPTIRRMARSFRPGPRASRFHRSECK